MTIMIASERQ